jgi:hypothetical protein
MSKKTKKTDEQERIENAATHQYLINKALKEKGLTINGFQYPLIGERKYTIEVVCSEPEQLAAAHAVVAKYAESIKGRLVVADVHVGATDWKTAKFVLLPYGSKA